MSRRLHQEISCDRPGCTRGYGFEGTPTAARRRAEAQGWSIAHHTGGKDRCPDHRKAART